MDDLSRDGEPLEDGKDQELMEGGELQDPLLKQPERDKIYINMEHFIDDLNAAKTLGNGSMENAKLLKYDVLESLKGYVIQ